MLRLIKISSLACSASVVNNEAVISDEEIIHNVLLVMVAGHDTSAILITFLVRAPANDPDTYAAVLQGMQSSKQRQLGFQ